MIRRRMTCLCPRFAPRMVAVELEIIVTDARQHWSEPPSADPDRNAVARLQKRPAAQKPGDDHRVTATIRAPMPGCPRWRGRNTPPALSGARPNFTPGVWAPVPDAPAARATMNQWRLRSSAEIPGPPMSPMQHRDEYRRNAETCLGLAKENVLPAARATLIRMAEAWLRLAELQDHQINGASRPQAKTG
jgi:hypothetical protein